MQDTTHPSAAASSLDVSALLTGDAQYFSVLWYTPAVARITHRQSVGIVEALDDEGRVIWEAEASTPAEVAEAVREFSQSWQTYVDAALREEREDAAMEAGDAALCDARWGR